jgi:BlaI family penicillinase repressor
MSDMAAKPAYRLGDLQLRIMRILWKSGSATVAEVHRELGADQLAYATVATMLRKMEGRGLVGHREEDRRFIYAPAVCAEDVTRSAVDDLVDRVFEGSLADAVNHLLENRDVSRQELTRLERMIQQRKKRRSWAWPPRSTWRFALPPGSGRFGKQPSSDYSPCSWWK